MKVTLFCKQSPKKLIIEAFGADIGLQHSKNNLAFAK